MNPHPTTWEELDDETRRLIEAADLDDPTPAGDGPDESSVPSIPEIFGTPINEDGLCADRFLDDDPSENDDSDEDQPDVTDARSPS